MLAFIRPDANSTFHGHIAKGLKLIIRLKLVLSHLEVNKFKHSFKNTLNPICNYGIAETTIHYLLHSPSFSNKKLKLLSKLQSINENTLNKDNYNISNVIFFGKHSFNDVKSYFNCFN